MKPMMKTCIYFRTVQFYNPGNLIFLWMGFVYIKYIIMAVDIRLASLRAKFESYHGEDPGNIVTPGDVITADSGFMRYAFLSTFWQR